MALAQGFGERHAIERLLPAEIIARRRDQQEAALTIALPELFEPGELAG